MMSDFAPIRVDYVENEELFLEAYDRLPPGVRTNPGARFGTVLLAVLGAGLMWYRSVADQRAGDPLWWLALVVVPVLFGLIWFWSFSPRAQRRGFIRGLSRHFEGASRMGTATFNGDGFVTARDDGRSKEHAWDTVPRVIIRPDGCFIFIDLTTSFWFPKRVFNPPSDFQRLEELLARRVPVIERVAT